MIKIAALTSGKDTPSSRFRVRQFIKPLSLKGIMTKEYSGRIEKSTQLPLIGKYFRVRYYLPLHIVWTIMKICVRIIDILRANKADVIWLERELVSGIISLEPFLRKPIIFDVDDAIWTSKPFGEKSAAKIASLAEIVVVGNRHLEQWFKKYAKNIEVIPTAIDTNRFKPKQKDETNKEMFVIGWTGSGGNLSYLYEIEVPLLQILKKYSNIEIHIISDIPPELKKLPENKVKYLKWSPENEVTALQHFDVGLMPLPDNEFTRGKCSFKMLQYMSVGLPVVVSPVGMNSELLAEGAIGFPASSSADWFDALDWLYKNRSKGKEMGLNGRAIVIRRYSQEVICRKLEAIFKRAANC